MRRLLCMVMLLVGTSHLFAAEKKEVEYLRQGTEYLAARDYQRAVKAFGQAARLDPDSAEAHRGMGMAYLKLGSGESATNPETLGNAASALREALRIAPDTAETRYHLGLTYLALYDKNAAVREYNVLKGLDVGLAEQLLSQISGYRPAPSFGVAGHRGAADGDEMRVTIAGNQVLVPVTLSHGDRTVQATLMLDTGASITLINREIAEKLEIDLDQAHRGRGQVVGGGVVEIRHARLDSITAGTHTKTGFDVAVLAREGRHASL